jgi:hypothetical protein
MGPTDRFTAWRTGKTTLFDAAARQVTQAGGIDPGLLKRLLIRALLCTVGSVGGPLSLHDLSLKLF